MREGQFGNLAYVIFHFLEAIPGWEAADCYITSDIIQDIIDGNGIFFKNLYGEDGNDCFEIFGYINFEEKFFIIDITDDVLNDELRDYLYRQVTDPEMLELFDKQK